MTSGGMTSTATVLAKNNQLTVLIKPPKGATLNLTRTLPSSLDTVVSLNQPEQSMRNGLEEGGSPGTGVFVVSGAGRRSPLATGDQG